MLVCLETAPKTNDRNHVLSLQRVVLCSAGLSVTAHVNIAVNPVQISTRVFFMSNPWMDKCSFNYEDFGHVRLFRKGSKDEE